MPRSAGSPMAGKKKVPADDHVIRYVPWNKLRKDENDQVIGVLAEAFRMRDGEKSLSSTWMEYFSGEPEEQMVAAVHAIRASNLKVKPKSGFAIGQVSAIQAECESRNYKIHIVHDPEEDNPAHATVAGLPRDDLQILECLAIGAWSDWRLNSAVPS